MTGIDGVDSASDGIEDGGGGGVAFLLDDLSVTSVGEDGTVCVEDRLLLSAVAGGFGRGSRGGGTVGGGNLPSSAIVGEVVVWEGKPADFSSSILCTTGSASSYKAKPW